MNLRIRALIATTGVMALFGVPAPGQTEGAPDVVGVWERTLFAKIYLPANTVQNPFAQIKLKATFAYSQGTFVVPVVCTGTTPQLFFPVYFAPPYTGSWTWSVSEEDASGAEPVYPEVLDLDPASGSFTCIASSAKGPWRPAASEGFPHAIVEPQGTGGVVYRWPLTCCYLTIADPRWRTFPAFTKYPTLPGTPNPSIVQGSNQIIISALDHAAAQGFNRIRIALNFSAQRGMEAAGAVTQPSPFVTPYQPAAAVSSTFGAQTNVLIQFSVFEHVDAVNGKFFRKLAQNAFSPLTAVNEPLIDFERFNLTTWSHIDWIIHLCKERGLQVAVTLTLNGGEGADFEDHYLADASDTPLPNVPDAGRLKAVTSAGPFAKRHELYYWYVAGRHCSYPNVQYVIAHEYQLPDGACVAPPIGGPATQWGCSMPASWIRWFGQEFAAVEPYLAHDPDMKITTTCPRRGSLYASHWSQTAPLNPKMGFTVNTNSGSFTSRRSQNMSDFLLVTDRAWSSCVGLQRGGEIGLSSVYGSTDDLYSAGGSFWPLLTAPQREGHRERMQLIGSEPCPIFIEEDWIVDNTIFPWRLPASTFDSLDNPYCVRPFHFLTPPVVNNQWTIPGPVATLPDNPYALPGLLNNQQGIEKWCRDTVWGSGIIAGAFVA